MNTIVRTNSVDGPNHTTTKARHHLAPPGPSRSVALIIAASCFAFAVIQLDVTIVNVALSRISEDLGATVTGLQWVVDAYTLGFAALLLSAGAVGDRLDSKRVFVAGLVGFALASLACGLAPGSGFLNAARAIQGIGAALLVPSSLAILNDACAHDPGLRARAIGIWTAAGGVAITAGPMVGGLLLTALGWRSIFLVNIPICALGLGLTLRCVPPARRKVTEWISPQGRRAHKDRAKFKPFSSLCSLCLCGKLFSPRPPSSPRPALRSSNKSKHRAFDLAGQALAIVALTALTGAVIEARPLGATHPMVAAAGLLALGTGAAFIAVEARTASPM